MTTEPVKCSIPQNQSLQHSSSTASTPTPSPPSFILSFTGEKKLRCGWIRWLSWTPETGLKRRYHLCNRLSCPCEHCREALLSTKARRLLSRLPSPRFHVIVWPLVPLEEVERTRERACKILASLGLRGFGSLHRADTESPFVHVHFLCSGRSFNLLNRSGAWREKGWVLRLPNNNHSLTYDHAMNVARYMIRSSVRYSTVNREKTRHRSFRRFGFGK